MLDNLTWSIDINGLFKYLNMRAVQNILQLINIFVPVAVITLVKLLANLLETRRFYILKYLFLRTQERKRERKKNLASF